MSGSLRDFLDDVGDAAEDAAEAETSQAEDDEEDEDAGDSPLRSLRERVRDGRILGVGRLRTKHAALEAGEAGADYVHGHGLVLEEERKDVLF